MNTRDISALMIEDICRVIYKACGYRVPNSAIAHRIGISAVTFSRIVSGVQTPSLSTFLRICKLHFSLVDDIALFVERVNLFEDYNYGN